MKLPTLLFPQVDKANHYAAGTGAAAIAACTAMVALALLHALVLHRALPVWLPAAGAVAALLAAYAAGFTKEWLDARANAKARAAGLPLPHGVEVADWQATAWGCVPVVLPLAALQLIVFVT